MAKFIIDGQEIPIGGSSSEEWELIQEITLESDISSFALEFDYMKEVVVVFKGRYNASDDSSSNAEQKVNVMVNGTRICDNTYFGYIRTSGATFTSLLLITQHHKYINGIANVYGGTTGQHANSMAILEDENGIYKINIVPSTPTNHVFKAGSSFTVFGKRV